MLTDSQGNPLSAEPTEVEKAPDALLTKVTLSYMRVSAFARMLDLQNKDRREPLSVLERDEVAKLMRWWESLGELRQGQVRRLSCEGSIDVEATDYLFK